jgi:hypothetical protein
VGGYLRGCYNDIREKPNVRMIFERSHTLGSDIIENNSRGTAENDGQEVGGNRLSLSSESESDGCYYSCPLFR